MIKLFFIIALVTGGVFTYNVLEDISNENSNNNHNGNFESTAAARPGTMTYGTKNTNQVDAGAANTDWNNNKRNDTNDLATARNQWRSAVNNFKRIEASNHTGRATTQGLRAYQEMQRTKRIYDNIVARSYNARR
jgi:hypothetical protein